MDRQKREGTRPSALVKKSRVLEAWTVCIMSREYFQFSMMRKEFIVCFGIVVIIY